MGNQQAVEGVTHHLFYKSEAKRYLSLRGTEVSGRGLGGIYCRFLFEDDQNDVVRLRACGLSDEDASWIGVSENLNVVCFSSDEQAANIEWCLEDCGENDNHEKLVALRSLFCDSYLCLVGRGEIRLSDGKSGDKLEPSCIFVHRMEQVPLRKQNNMRKFANWFPSGPSEVKDYPPSTLTQEQIETFHREGFIVLKDAIPYEMIEQAKEKISEGLEAGVDRKKVLGMERQRWTKEYRTAGEIKQLINATSLLKSCEVLMDGAPVVEPPEAQIAIRKPMPGKDFALELDWHIDAYEKITAARFGVLVVIALSDWTHDDMGNFTVYPSSHIKVPFSMKNLTNFTQTNNQTNNNQPTKQTNTNLIIL